MHFAHPGRERTGSQERLGHYNLYSRKLLDLFYKLNEKGPAALESTKIEIRKDDMEHVACGA
jgi:hypothetical protein